MAQTYRYQSVGLGAVMTDRPMVLFGPTPLSIDSDFSTWTFKIQ